ncbi:hypothetical protein CHCC15543_2681 [Bacillus licheniformis]|nr:hypothetical protein CHCC15543_2681 [Bacillus licheniformis]
MVFYFGMAFWTKKNQIGFIKLQFWLLGNRNDMVNVRVLSKNKTTALIAGAAVTLVNVLSHGLPGIRSIESLVCRLKLVLLPAFLPWPVLITIIAAFL